MKALVFIDHDIMCRHFINSGALAPLTRSADTTFVFPDDNGRRVKLNPDDLPLGAPWLRLQIDSRRQQIWRWILFCDQLRWRHGRHEAAIRRLRWSTLGWKAALLLTLAGLPFLSMLFRRWTQRRLEQQPNRALVELLDREQPDVIVHPSVLEGVFINDLVMEGRARGIPVVIAMNSWDNPSTKRAVVGQPDWLLVWGPQTYNHSVRFLHMPPQRVLKFGAAQFDVFRTPPRIDRAAFCKPYGFDPALPIVLFAGANTETDEVAAIMALDAAIESGRLPKMSILYRPHPWGGGGHNGERLLTAEWRHVKLDETMRAYVSRLGSGNAKPELPDYKITHDLLSAVDVVVSPLSTMLVEAMLHGKSALCFIPAGDLGSERLRDAMPMLHFEDFLSIPEVVTARTIDDIVAALPALVAADTAESRSTALRTAAEHFVTPHQQPWGDRLVQLLQSQVLPAASRSMPGNSSS